MFAEVITNTSRKISVNVIYCIGSVKVVYLFKKLQNAIFREKIFLR